MSNALKRCASLFLEKLSCGPLQKCGPRCQWVSTWSSENEDCGDCEDGFWKGNWTQTSDIFLLEGDDVNEADEDTCVIIGNSGTCYGPIHSAEDCPSTPDVSVQDPPPIAAPDQCFCDNEDIPNRRAWIYCVEVYNSSATCGGVKASSSCSAINICAGDPAGCVETSPTTSLFYNLVSGPHCVGSEAVDALNDCNDAPPC